MSEPKDRSIKLAALLALSYSLLFNGAIFLFKFDYYKANILRGSLELCKDFFYIYITAFIIFFGLSINRFLLLICSLFLFITGAIASYTLFFFKIPPSKQIIRAMFEGEIAETYEVVSIKLILWILFSISIAIWIQMRSQNLVESRIRRNRRRFKNPILAALMTARLPIRFAQISCLIIFTLNIISPHYKILKAYFPIQYLHNTYLYKTERAQKIQKLDISREFDFIDESSNDIVGVLVIGEAARYDHFGINGYERNTTPNLEKMQNLFSFKAQASANLTYLSVPYMLSRAPRDNIEDALRETTFLSILTRLGFNTTWIGTQSLVKYLSGYGTEIVYDEVGMAIIPGGSALYEMNAHDEVLLPYIDNALLKPGKKFLVIHTSGSHWNHSSRYPKEYDIFKPGCIDNRKNADQIGCGDEGLINTYDNSILYTDYILHQIMQRLADKNAFMIYASDHAESLGENGIYAHGSHMVPEQTTIPFIFWASDKFIADHKGLLRDLKIAHDLNHEYIFHSVLDCLGVRSSIINTNLSLCSANSRN